MISSDVTNRPLTPVRPPACLRSIFLFIIGFILSVLFFSYMYVSQPPPHHLPTPFPVARRPLATHHTSTAQHTLTTPRPLTKLTADDIPNPIVRSHSCSKLINKDRKELKSADRYQKTNEKKLVSTTAYLSMTKNCVAFKKERHYITIPLNQEEASFPLAYSLLIFKDIEQFERLLRAIYRPQNFYCVHVDAKSSDDFKAAANGVVGCFDNVFMASKSVDVKWGEWSVLEPDLTCMKDLLRYKSWKYFINLTGQEFPLKTNWDIVRILKVYRGANNMEGTVKRRNKNRTAHKGKPPSGITLTKGSVHITANRAFVDFAINNRTAQKFADWLKDTYVPDESFFSSLDHSPQLGIPGAYKGDPETDTKTNLFITRFKNWGDGPFNYPCMGQRVRMICIFSAGDLPLLATRPELFANKFYLDWEPLALDCMEELHFNRTRDQFIQQDSTLDLSFYENLDFVKNHVIPPDYDNRGS